MLPWSQTPAEFPITSHRYLTLGIKYLRLGFQNVIGIIPPVWCLLLSHTTFLLVVVRWTLGLVHLESLLWETNYKSVPSLANIISIKVSSPTLIPFNMSLVTACWKCSLGGLFRKRRHDPHPWRAPPLHGRWGTYHGNSWWRQGYIKQFSSPIGWVTLFQ